MDNPLLGQDILNSISFSKDTLDFLNSYTQDIEKAYQQEQGLDLLKNRILASLFLFVTATTVTKTKMMTIRKAIRLITLSLQVLVPLKLIVWLCWRSLEEKPSKN